ncbi:MAG: hypothetical protein WCC03_05525 [Candidatus Acidiferrales bacterium]
MKIGCPAIRLPISSIVAKGTRGGVLGRAAEYLFAQRGIES